MKKLLPLSIAALFSLSLCLTFFSCKKKDTPPANNTPAPAPDNSWIPQKNGNYWDYMNINGATKITFTISGTKTNGDTSYNVVKHTNSGNALPDLYWRETSDSSIYQYDDTTKASYPLILHSFKLHDTWFCKYHGTVDYRKVENLSTTVVVPATSHSAFSGKTFSNCVQISEYKSNQLNGITYYFQKGVGIIMYTDPSGDKYFINSYTLK